MDLKKILIISGPTATGKTDLAIQIAKKHQCEIVNFDSLLFYKELSIGTAKPTKEEQAGITHHMVNSENINKHINAADYCRKVLPIIDDIHRRGKSIILVGGSGFYLRALIKGMFPTPTPSPETTKKSEELYKDQGIAPFLKILEENDPDSFKKLHANDHYRVRRAVEFFWSANYPISQAPSKQKEFTPRYIEKGWKLEHIYLNIPKEQHYSIIEKRAQLMLANGLINEVEQLLKNGFSQELKPLQSIGYKETLAFIRGEINSAEDLVESIFISTRRLAKSQRTWFKSVDNKHEVNPFEGLTKAIEIAFSFFTD